MSIKLETETKKPDPRVVRTRQMLREALVANILEKGYDATSIQDITDRGGLRRATFYLHYRDKDELMFSLIRDMLEELLQKIESEGPHGFNAAGQGREDLLVLLHVQEHADLYRAVLRGQGAVEITRSVRDYLAGRIREQCVLKYPETDLSVPLEVVANYLASVKMQLMIWWLDNGMPYPPQQMAEMCARLALHGAGPVLEPYVTR
jgi:AcrR family transcriptional regulator